MAKLLWNYSRYPGGTVVECWIEDPEVPSSNTNQGSQLQKKKGHNCEQQKGHNCEWQKKVIIVNDKKGHNCEWQKKRS